MRALRRPRARPYIAGLRDRAFRALAQACNYGLRPARGSGEHRALLVACVLWLALATAASAQGPAGPTTPPVKRAPILYQSTEEDRDADAESLGKGETIRAGEREHEGFFLRLSLGPGAAYTSYEERVDGTRVSDVTTSGLAGIIEVALGGRAIGNLIVHGNLLYTRYASATRFVDGVKDAAEHVSASGVMLGGGATYYFMPYNVYLSGALGPAWQIEERRGGDVAGNTGFFVAFAAGKEWWVGNGEWGLGAALRGTFASGQVDIAGVRSTSRLGNLGLAFCATFN